MSFSANFKAAQLFVNAHLGTLCEEVLWWKQSGRLVENAKFHELVKRLDFMPATQRHPIAQSMIADAAMEDQVQLMYKAAQ